MENITVNVFDDVLYLAWEFVYLIFFTRFVCVHGNYKNACAILISGIKEQIDTITNRYNKWLYLFHISSC